MRPSSDEYFMAMALLVASRGTCARRRVGCVLINKRRHVLATGYNGVAPGLPHCIDIKCEGASAPSGTSLDACEASHAEQSALLQCRDVYEIETAYCTASPCVQCIKLLMNTGCKRIVFWHEYPHGKSKELWESMGREWVQYPLTSRNNLAVGISLIVERIRNGTEVQETNTQLESVAIIRT